MKNGSTCRNDKVNGRSARLLRRTPLLVHPKRDVSMGSLYLIYDRKDADDGTTFAARLRGAGYEIHTPVFDNDIILQRRYHESCLMQSDSMIILAFQANREWIHAKMVDIIKSPGLGRARPIRRQLILWHSQRQSANLVHIHRFELIEYSGYDNAMRSITSVLSAS